MFSYSINEKIRLYYPVHSFLSIIEKKIEDKIENGEYERFLTSSLNELYTTDIDDFQDPVDKLVSLALSAKKLIEENKVDKQTVLFSLSKIYPLAFNELNEETYQLYSQAPYSEINDFIEQFKKTLLLYSPRFDTNLTILLKIQHYINVYLYFALSFHEKRFPYGSSYYDFITFQLREFYTILKPLAKEKGREIKHICSSLMVFLPFHSIIYLFDHYPEQVTELIFILTKANNFTVSEDEKEILLDYLNSMIYISPSDKNDLILKLE